MIPTNITDNIQELNPDEVEQVNRILSQPNRPEAEMRRLHQQQWYFVMNDLLRVLNANDKTKMLLNRIGVKEELKRIRNGLYCVQGLPEAYFRGIKDAFAEWGELAFYRGRWELGKPRKSDNLPQTSMRYIHTGSNILRDPKVFKKDPTAEKFNFLLGLQWNRIDNSYKAMFDERR